MTTGFYEKLLNGIIIVSVLLAMCVVCDYATNTVAGNQTVEQVNINNTEKVLLLDENDSNIELKSTDKVHTVEQKKKALPTVSMWARPSVRSNYAYKWYYVTFVDYCPHCHKYGVLFDAHKWQARYEHEWTCKNCGADYCAVVGKEKYSWSNYYLTRA